MKSVTAEKQKPPSLLAAGVAVAICILGFGYGTYICGIPPAPAAMSSKPPLAGKGTFGTYTYTFETNSGTSVFLFEPRLPLNDDTWTAAIRHVLVANLGANLENYTIEDLAPVLRYVTVSGSFDVRTMTGPGSTSELIGFSIQIPK